MNLIRSCISFFFHDCHITKASQSEWTLALELTEAGTGHEGKALEVLEEGPG